MPWQMSHAAYTESENAELQTDVMRFMAILAFCLVAVFAIVQSIPATSAPVADREAAAPSPSPVARPQPVVEPAPEAAPERSIPQPIVLQRAEAVAAKKPVQPVPLRRSLPRPPDPDPRHARIKATAAAPPSPAVSAPAPDVTARVQQGLSLRFESDAVLRSLVARGLVGLYAIDGGAYYRMEVDADRVRFSRGRAPAQYHEMIADTVPGDVRRSFGAGASAVTWGVTLPAATSRQLARFVRTSYSGSLVITADAQLALSGRGGA